MLNVVWNIVLGELIPKSVKSIRFLQLSNLLKSTIAIW
jgi:hypothetical protein